MSDSRQIAGAETFARRSVLVVEDEFLIALDIQRILESAGVARVVTANRVAQALASLASNGPFDAAVLDLKLEHEASTPVAEYLTANNIPFIFLTGGTLAPDITNRFPAAPVVSKPFDGDALLSTLGRLLAAKP